MIYIIYIIFWNFSKTLELANFFFSSVIIIIISARFLNLRICSPREFSEIKTSRILPDLRYIDMIYI